MLTFRCVQLKVGRFNYRAGPRGGAPAGQSRREQVGFAVTVSPSAGRALLAALEIFTLGLFKSRAK